MNKKIKEGSLLRIKLDASNFAYGRVLRYSEMAFYNYKDSSPKLVNLDDLYDAPVAFIVPVYGSAKKSGRWELVGIRPLEQYLLEQRLYFICDNDTGRYSLYENDTGKIYPAPQEACHGLERAAVWEAEHVESRLRDFFDGKENKWVKQLK